MAPAVALGVFGWSWSWLTFWKVQIWGVFNFELHRMPGILWVPVIHFGAVRFWSSIWTHVGCASFWLHSSQFPGMPRAGILRKIIPWTAILCPNTNMNMQVCHMNPWTSPAQVPVVQLTSFSCPFCKTTSPLQHQSSEGVSKTFSRRRSYEPGGSTTAPPCGVWAIQTPQYGRPRCGCH